MRQEIKLQAQFVCFNCRKAFERFNKSKENTSICPECNSLTIKYNPRFKVPKKTNDKQWKKVAFLRDRGFYFQKIYKKIDDCGYQRVPYPKDLNEAKEFVEIYQEQAIILNE